MKKQKLTTTRTILFALTLAVMVAIPTIRARAQAGEIEPSAIQSTAQGGGLLDVIDRIKQAQAQALEGSWIVTVTPVVPPGVPQPPSFRAYASFARGGVVINSDRTRPFSSPRHGAWVHTGGNEFATTQIEDAFDGQGNFQGTLTIRQRITITGANTFVGVANGEVRDAAGNLTFTGCTTTRGERIKVEPLPQQCQSVTPPQ